MAARFWVGGTGTWDAADTTHWAASSGGAGGQTVPGASDTVTFDSVSGGGTVTVGYNPTVTSIAAGTFTGTIDFSTRTVTVSGIFNISGTSTRAINLTNAIVSCVTWTATTVTNLTFTSTGSSLTVVDTFNGGGLSYNSVIHSPTGGAVTVAGANTYATLTWNGASSKTIAFSLSANQTVTGTLTVNANSLVNRTRVYSGTIGTSRTVSAGTLVCTNTILFRDITGAGAATWTVAGSGASAFGDSGGNSGITFTTSAQQTWSGTSGGNWSTNAWTSRVPLPQDDVVIASAFSASQTITNDMPELGRSITWVGSTGSPTWAFSSAAISIYGSLTLIAGMSISGTQATSLLGRSTYTLTCATRTFTQAITIGTASSVYTVSDAFITNGVLTLGGLGAVTFQGDVTASTFVQGTFQTLTMGNGTWTLTSTAATTIWSASTVAQSSAIIPGSSTIVVGNASANTRTFVGGGQPYGTLTYTVAGSTGMLTVTGSNTFAVINFSDVTNVRTLRLTSATTTTISTLNGFNVDGTAGLLMTIDSSSAGSAATLTSPHNQTVSYASIKDSAATGGGVWLASQSTSVSGNSGWYFGDAAVFDGDTGAGLEDEVSIGLTDSDTGAGADGNESSTLDLTDADTGIGAEAEAYLASLADADTGSGDDGGESQGFGFFDDDFGTGTDGESIAAAMADADTGSGADGETVHQQAVRRIRASGREPLRVAAGSEQSA